MMEIPKDMKGLEKSITSSRTRVMVRGAMAMSAFWKRAKRMRSDAQEMNLCQANSWEAIDVTEVDPCFLLLIDFRYHRAKLTQRELFS